MKARPSVLWCYKKELGFSRCVCVMVNVGRKGRGHTVCGRGEEYNHEMNFY